MPCRKPCRFYIHLAFTYFVGPLSIVWSELGPALPFPPMRVLEKWKGVGSQSRVWSGPEYVWTQGPWFLKFYSCSKSRKRAFLTSCLRMLWRTFGTSYKQENLWQQIHILTYFIWEMDGGLPNPWQRGPKTYHKWNFAIFSYSRSRAKWNAMPPRTSPFKIRDGEGVGEGDVWGGWQ